MKILIADTQFPFGHKMLNSHLLEILSQCEVVNELKVLNFRGYYSSVKYDNVKLYELSVLFSSKNVYINYLYQFLNVFVLFFRCIGLKYDRVIFFTFDTLPFFLLQYLLHKPIYLFHHNNTDHLQNKYKKLFFKCYMNNVNHIVLGDFIKKYLVNIGVNKDRIFILPHTLPYKTVPTQKLSKCKKDNKCFIALGNSNDEELLSEIIDYERVNHLLEINNIKLVLRSQIYRNDLPVSITIISNYLSRQEYEDFYTQCDGVLILYPLSFINRYSGIMFDAFCSRKIVIGRKIPIVQYFAEKYPNSCMLFESVDHLFNLLCHNYTFDEKEFHSFVSFHSDGSVKSYFDDILL